MTLGHNGGMSQTDPRTPPPHDAVPAPGAAPLPRRPARWTWWLALLLCLAAVPTVHAAFVASNAGQLLEYQLFHAVEGRYQAAPDALEGLVSVLPPGVAALVGLAALVCLAPRRARGRAVLALVVLVGTNLAAQVLKEVLPRPDLDNGVPWTAGNSLPSGHMALAGGAAVALVVLVPARWRPPAALAGAALTAFTGAAVFLEAWHRPSDMAAAVLLAAAWGLLVLPLALPRDVAPAGARGGRAVEVLLWTAGALACIVGAALLAATLAAPATTSDPHPLAAPAGVLLSAGPSVLLLGLLLTAARRGLARVR